MSAALRLFETSTFHPGGGALNTSLPVQFTLIRACARCPVPFWMAVPSGQILQMHGYAGGNVQSDLLRLGIWDMAETKVVASILHHGCSRGGGTGARQGSALMVDVGANTGFFSAMALANGCRVHAFEPTLAHEPYLSTSAALSKNPSRFTLHQKLVSDTTGQSLPFDTWNLADSRRKGVQTTVESVRVDDIIDEPVLYLKMDIEGHEPAGFRGLQRLLRRHQVDFILWEHSPRYYSHEEKSEPPSKLLRQLGYWVSSLGHGGMGNYVAIHPNARPDLAQAVRARVAPASFRSKAGMRG